VRGLRIIPTSVHGVIDYAVGILLIAAPWIFGAADNRGAKWTWIIVGAIMLGSALMTNYELGVMHLIPMHVHLAMDTMLGLFLAASPWIVGYSNEGLNGWLPPLVVGLAEVGTSMMSRPWPERRELVAREERMFKHAARV
jgi:SPW repeat-containing protein